MNPGCLRRPGYMPDRISGDVCLELQVSFLFTATITFAFAKDRGAYRGADQAAYALSGSFSKRCPKTHLSISSV